MNSTHGLKVWGKKFNLYLHGLKEVVFTDKLEVCKMDLRGEHDDPSDLSAAPSPHKLDPVMGWGPDQ